MSKLSLKNPATLTTTVMGVGLIKQAPGTWGSLVGVILSVLLMNLPYVRWGVVLIGFLLGLKMIPEMIKNQFEKDPGYIVIDEFVAQMLIFCCLPVEVLNPIIFIFGFSFFRLFDILKPWPASYYDQKVHNAFGIMMDDMVAAVYSVVALYAIVILSL